MNLALLWSAACTFAAPLSDAAVDGLTVGFGSAGLTIGGALAVGAPTYLVLHSLDPDDHSGFAGNVAFFSGIAGATAGAFGGAPVLARIRGRSSMTVTAWQLAAAGTGGALILSVVAIRRPWAVHALGIPGLTILAVGVPAAAGVGATLAPDRSDASLAVRPMVRESATGLVVSGHF